MAQKDAARIGFAFAIFGTLLFSLKSIFIKLLYAEGLDANTVLTLRMALALPFYVAILIWQLRKQPHRPSHNLILKITLFGFFGYYLASLLDLLSLEYISAQLERLGLFTYPLLVALLGRLFFKIAITRTVIISLLLTYTGLCIVMLQELSYAGNNVFLGTLLVLGSALSFAIYVLLSKPIISEIGSVFFTSIAMIASGLFVFLHSSIWVDFQTLTVSPNAWSLLLLLAVFSTVLPSFLISEAIHRIGPIQTGIMGTLGPLFTIGLAFLLLDESLSLLALFGIALVLLGILYLMLAKKTKTKH